MAHDDDVGLSPDDLEDLCDEYETAMEAALEALAEGNLAKAESVLREVLGEPDEEDEADDEDDDDEDED